MSAHDDGFFSLGQLLGGGNKVAGEAAFLEGLDTGSRIRSRQASTESAIAQARLRRNKAEAQEELKSLAEEMGIDPGDATLGLAGLNPEQFSGATLDRQTGGFRDIIADIDTPAGTRQRAAQAIEGKVVDPFQIGPGGELFADVFADEPQLDVTQTGEAQIALDVERTEKARQDALLAEAKRLNPSQFKSSFSFAAPQDGRGLGDIIAEDIVPSTMPADFDPSQATGVRGALQSLSNIPFDIANQNLPFPETSVAENALQQLANRMSIVGQQAMPGRPNVKLMDMLATFGVQPNTISKGDQRSVDLLRQTSRFLHAETESLIRQLNGGRLTNTQVGEFERGLRGLLSLMQDFDVTISRFDASNPQQTAGGGTFTLVEE